MHIFGKWRQAGMIGGDKTTRKELCLENLEKEFVFIIMRPIKLLT